jgi:hypothetical protein
MTTVYSYVISGDKPYTGRVSTQYSGDCLYVCYDAAASYSCYLGTYNKASETLNTNVIQGHSFPVAILLTSVVCLLPTVQCPDSIQSEFTTLLDTHVHPDVLILHLVAMYYEQVGNMLE